MPLNQATSSAKNKDDDTSKDETFVTTKGWFDRFQKRTGCHNTGVHGKATSADTEAAKDLP
jgi:hypothetical protein